MIAMSLKKMSSNLHELERRMKELQNTTAHVGVDSTDGIHEGSGMLYTELHWLHHSGYTTNGRRVPARPVSTVVRYTFKGEDILRKGLDKYFSNLNKKGGVISAEAALKPWLTSMLDYAKYEVFGSTTKLESNSPYTIKMKGFDSPMVDTGELRDQWKVRINGTVVSE